MRPSFAISPCPSEYRGRRESRVRAAPAVSRARCAQEHAHEHTGSAESIRPSLRNGFTAYSALSPATNSCCHRRLRIDDFAHPGRARKISAGLTSATDARTTRLRRTQQPPPHTPAGDMPPAEVLAKALKRRSSARRLIAHRKPALRFHLRARRCRVHRISTRVRDDRDPPLLSGETGGDTPLICPGGARGIFS